VSEQAPSRSLILELREERHSMSEGHAFLEEKSLLLAAGIVRELARHDVLRRAAESAARAAVAALAGALARHGLEELAVLPAPDLSAARLIELRSLVVGVPVIEARFEGGEGASMALPWTSPEARAGRAAFGELLAAAIALGASAGNLRRLSAEYRKSIRRERALADVLIPEMDQQLASLEARLEDLEREEAINMRSR
jgi:V/A-type H+-transporting ATPase subunit D